MFDSAAVGIRKWLVELFVLAIKQIAKPEDRQAAIQWLLKSRDILASDLSLSEKLKALNEQIKARAAVSALAEQVAAAVKGYRTAKVPWAVKIAIPATLLAMPVVGLHGAGIAAFGTAIGLPVLLLVFLGTAGITSVIEGVVANPHSAAGIALIAKRLAEAETARRARKQFRDEMTREPVAPRATEMPGEEMALREMLLAMDPYDFERHVMSFFEKAGLEAVVTPKGRDFGLDGYAMHPKGLIAVQCKRYSTKHKVGSPAIQRFRTIMTDGNAWRGYFVTTSSFTASAVECASQTKNLFLVDMDELVRWHVEGFTVAE